MSDFRPMSVGIVLLGVSDLPRSVAFYRDRLGMAVRGQSEGFAFLDGGPVTLALSREVAEHSPAIVGATEVVFSVTGVRAAHAALRERGIEFTHAPRNVTGAQWAANFTDPDGHRLSVFGPE